MRDIETREDIENLITVFYSRVMCDELIGYIFTDVAKIDLSHHLPIISDFWEMILFRNINFQEKYGRSPMQTHQALNRQTPLKKEHFSRWLEIFCKTIDESFTGDKAKLAKSRALSIAQTMFNKFSEKDSSTGHFFPK